MNVGWHVKSISLVAVSRYPCARRGVRSWDSQPYLCEEYHESFGEAAVFAICIDRRQKLQEGRGPLPILHYVTKLYHQTDAARYIAPVVSPKSPPPPAPGTPPFCPSSSTQVHATRFLPPQGAIINVRLGLVSQDLLHDAALLLLGHRGLRFCAGLLVHDFGRRDHHLLQ